MNLTEHHILQPEKVLVMSEKQVESMKNIKFYINLIMDIKASFKIFLIYSFELHLIDMPQSMMKKSQID